MHTGKKFYLFNLITTLSLLAGMLYQGGLSASFGSAWEAGNTIHWNAAATASDVAADGGFEADTPNPYWAETSTTYGTPLCGPPCGPGAHTGDWWAWFGASYSDPETASLEQLITFPSGGKANLTFWLRIADDRGTGFLRVLVDRDQLFYVTQDDASSYQGYRQVTLDVSDYIAGQHSLRFESTTSAYYSADFFVDDVAVMVGDPLPGEITIRFDVQVDGPTGSLIKNNAFLGWGADHTDAQHILMLPEAIVFFPLIFG